MSISLWHAKGMYNYIAKRVTLQSWVELQITADCIHIYDMDQRMIGSRWCTDDGFYNKYLVLDGDYECVCVC
jgi:hypothetical protein